LDLPQAKPMKIRPKYGNARLRMSIMGMRLFHHDWPRIGGTADRQQQRLIRPFASSIGHNDGLFDEI
jgi:hypothetical protein